MRISREQYYIQIARTVAMKSPCSRRKFGAVIVKDGAIVSTGYNGSPRGTKNCGIDIQCLKDVTGEARYKSYANCPAVHAEQNAVINAARVGAAVFGGTLYLSPLQVGDGDRPCHLCRREIINAGIKDCYYLDQNENLVHEEISGWIALENQWMDDIFEEPDHPEFLHRRVDE